MSVGIIVGIGIGVGIGVTAGSGLGKALAERAWTGFIIGECFGRKPKNRLWGISRIKIRAEKNMEGEF
ncbi:MAG: hypothetical protein M1426_01875 [Patescibacteria group bacterium]|nr:hypothetical protein [Patescibacteria group bacterium]